MVFIAALRNAEACPILEIPVSPPCNNSDRIQHYPIHHGDLAPLLLVKLDGARQGPGDFQRNT